MNFKGQFFSPDMIVAVGVFIFALVVFFSASSSVFSQVSLIDEQRQADEVAHTVINGLVLSPGQPSNWENTGISSAYSLGLAFSNNEIASQKIISLINSLNDSNSYLEAKSKLGAAQFDFYLSLLDSSGNVVSYSGYSLSGGQIAVNPKAKFSYKRFVLFNGTNDVLEAVFSRS